MEEGGLCHSLSQLPVPWRRPVTYLRAGSAALGSFGEGAVKPLQGAAGAEASGTWWSICTKAGCACFLLLLYFFFIFLHECTAIAYST